MKTCEFCKQPTNSTMYHESHVICPDCLGRLKEAPQNIEQDMKSKITGWSLWLLWIGASAGGMFLGFIGAFLVGAVIYPVLGNAATDVAIGICVGTGIGLAQWFVLKCHITGSTWGWIPAGAIAGFGILAAAIGAFGIPRGTMAATGVAVAGGAATGVLQWLILRKKVTWVGWWIPACAVSWGLGLLVVNTTPFGGGDGGAFLALVAGAAFLGIITGGVLVWLLRHPSTKPVDTEIGIKDEYE